MASSAVDICNSALVKVGAARIISLSDDSEGARLCNEQYEKIRDEMLRGHPWNFATARVELAAVAEEPEFEYDFKFLLPADCLRVLGTDLDTSSDFKIEGRYILSYEDTIKIKYIKKVTNVGEMDTTFAEALALNIAQDICYTLSGSAALAELLYRKYEAKLREARSYDAQEGSADRIQADEWLNSRY